MTYTRKEYIPPRPCTIRQSDDDLEVENQLEHMRISYHPERQNLYYEPDNDDDVLELLEGAYHLAP